MLNKEQPVRDYLNFRFRRSTSKFKKDVFHNKPYIVDYVLSLTIILLTLPIFLLLYIFSFLFSFKNPIYKQVRMGQHRKPFLIYKFRSMIENAENGLPILVTKDDPRITKWGKFLRKTHLDELPQFYNVLKGDMSIVGPRPERKYFVDQIIKELPEYESLLSVKPGITSLGQIKFGYAQNVQEMIVRAKIDLSYLENRNFLSDLKIIYWTILDVLKARGF